jgi:hypothetical protein
MFPFSTVPSKNMFSAILYNTADNASSYLTPVCVLEGLLLVFAMSTLYAHSFTHRKCTYEN